MRSTMTTEEDPLRPTMLISRAASVYSRRTICPKDPTGTMAKGLPLGCGPSSLRGGTPFSFHPNHRVTSIPDY